MAAPSVRSAGSGSKRSTPTTVDGTVFLKVRQCPMSGKKNTDYNVISRGKFGPDYSKFMIWHRGSAQNPDGKFERVSLLTWQHGGFADKWQDPDTFVKQLQSDTNLQREFDAAYKAMVAIIEEGRMRFRLGEKEKVNLRLEEARKTTVKTFAKTELNLKTTFRAVERTVYERAHPGRIEKRGMKVATCKKDGKPIEVVLIPKLPDGHFDLEANDIQGAIMETTVDDGEAAIRADQMKDKFESVVKGALAEVNQSLGNALLEEEAEVSEAENVRERTDNEDTSTEGDPTEEGEDLTFVRETFFAQSSTTPPSHKQSKKPPNRANPPAPSPSPVKAARSESPATLPSAAAASTSRATSKAATPRPAKTKPANEPQQAAGKFEGKSPREILDKFGLHLILQDLEEAERLMGHAELNRRMIDEALYSNALKDFQKKTSVAHKAVVNLDIKIKKWSHVPEDLSDYVQALRSKTGAMNDASKTFLCGKRVGGNPEKMRTVIAALTELSLDVPEAWNGMLLVESIRDHVRFNQVDDMIAMFKEAAGSTDESSLHLVEAAAEAIKGSALKLPSPIEDAQEGVLLCLKELAGGLAQLKELGDDAMADCAILADVLAFGPTSRAKQNKALADLQHMRQDLSGYHGVLKGFLATENFGSLAAWVESGVDDQESTLLCSQLKDSFQNLAKEDVLADERSRFNALLQRALSTMAGDQEGNVKAAVKQVLGGLAECMNAVPNKLEDHVQEACALCDLPKAQAKSKVESAASSIKVLIGKLFRRAVFDIDDLLSGMSAEASAKLLTKTSMADAVGMLRKIHATILAKKGSSGRRPGHSRCRERTGHPARYCNASPSWGCCA